MRISDWSADVCSSDLFILQVDDLLLRFEQHGRKNEYVPVQRGSVPRQRLDRLGDAVHPRCFFDRLSNEFFHVAHPNNSSASSGVRPRSSIRSEEHTSELQSLMRISYAVFCLKKKKQIIHT